VAELQAAKPEELTNAIAASVCARPSTHILAAAWPGSGCCGNMRRSVFVVHAVATEERGARVGV